MIRKVSVSLWLRTVFLGVTVAIGCSSTRDAGPHQTDAPHMPSAGAVHEHAAHKTPIPAHAGTETAEMEALFFERRQNDRMNFTDADVTFMQMMIPHHAQALIMSRLAPQNEAGAAVQRLAARILNAQADEIKTMQTWLRDRGQAVPVVHIDGLDMHIIMEEPPGTATGEHAGHMKAAKTESDAHAAHTMAANTMDHSGHTMADPAADPMHHHHDMPGMLTPAQLAELAAARGTEFDRLFLTYMIGHHAGAVVMVNDLFASDGGGTDRESYRLASDIYTEQITEIDMMGLMLRTLQP